MHKTETTPLDGKWIVSHEERTHIGTRFVIEISCESRDELIKLQSYLCKLRNVDPL